ncbi:glycosyltransferase family 4 protein [Kosakonia pseudosacchari]|uniref:glycosyltransferase family 4 protein n=1 Tax=Kosakonia pseudosacchari TaxID=1646340 RepID=UPI000A393EB7|nr:glycosyltransferase [Kosakonia pseudosacchari]
MQRLIFIQPAIASYRQAFYKGLAKNFKVEVYACKKDFLNVKSITLDEHVIQHYSPGFISFFRKKIFWHMNLPLIKCAKKNDVVILNGNPRIINYMLLLIICRLRRIKVIWWGHGWSSGSYGVLAKFRLRIMCLANLILLYTDRECEMVKHVKTYALNNGLDSNSIKNEIKKHSANIVRDPNLIKLIFVGRLTPKANILFLIKALKYTPGNIHLDIVGDGEMKEQIDRAIADNGLRPRVRLLGALFDESSLAKIMMSSDAFVYPGAVGLSLIHAFNYGLPAIIHDDERYHMPEFSAFKNKVNGFSYKRGSQESLIKTLTEFASLPQTERDAISLKAMKTIQYTYNTDDMVKRMTNIIEHLTSKG